MSDDTVSVESMSSLSLYQAQDMKNSNDEYATNKIFVGGLHYETRDGKTKNVSLDNG